MKIAADLHLHSNRSDGLLNPEQIIERLKYRNIEFCSLTDHDTVEGVDEFIRCAENNEIEAVSGVELSCQENETQIHILGYHFDHHHPDLLKQLTLLLDRRRQRIQRVLELLKMQNLVFREVDFFNRYPGPYWGRPQIAQFLIDLNLVSGFQKAFDLYLGIGKPAYIPNSGMTVSEGIDWIHQFGGIAVLAHPVLYLDKFPLAYWQSFDFDGIELIHPAQKSMIDIREIRRIALRNNWVVTGGSDFHGGNRNGYIEKGITHLDLTQFLKRIG